MITAHYEIMFQVIVMIRKSNFILHPVTFKIFYNYAWFKILSKCVIFSGRMAKARPGPENVSSDSESENDFDETPGIREFMAKFSGAEATIKFLRTVGLLLTTVWCHKCQKPMKEQDLTVPRSNGDTKRWQCSKCKRTHSLRHGSIFYVRKIL